MTKRFNEVIALDVGELEGRKFLMMVDMATNYIQAAWLKNKNPITIVEKLFENWMCVFGIPKILFSDNGLEFQNEELKIFTKKLGIKMKSTAADSQWSNGKCEKMVGLLKDGIRKLRDDTTKNWEIALRWSVAAKNDLMMTDGISPNQLVFGKNNTSSLLQEESEITTNTCENAYDMLYENLKSREEARKIHLEQEANKKLRIALSKNVRDHRIEDARIGDEVYYKRENEKCWRGPAKILGLDGKTIIIKHGSTLREVNRIHITRIRGKPKESLSDQEEDEEEDEDEIQGREEIADQYILEENIETEDEEEYSSDSEEETEESDFSGEEEEEEMITTIQAGKRYEITNR